MTFFLKWSIMFSEILSSAVLVVLESSFLYPNSSLGWPRGDRFYLVAAADAGVKSVDNFWVEALLSLTWTLRWEAPFDLLVVLVLTYFSIAAVALASCKAISSLGGYFSLFTSTKLISKASGAGGRKSFTDSTWAVSMGRTLCLVWSGAPIYLISSRTI